MAGKEDESVFRRVEKLGFQVKATPQHLLQSLPLASKEQHNRDAGLLSPTGAKERIISVSGSGASAPIAGGVLSQQPGQLSVPATSNCPVTVTKTLRTLSPGFPHLLPPIASPSIPQWSGSGPPSPYLDVSTAASTFNCSSSPVQLQHPQSPLGQPPRCLSPLLHSSQHSPNSTGVCSPSHRYSSATDAASVYKRSSQDEGLRLLRHTISAGASNPEGKTEAASASETATAVAALQDSATAAVSRSQPSSAAAGARNKQQKQRRLPAGRLSTSGGSCKAAALSRARRRKRGWDDNVNIPAEPSFEDALNAWYENMEAGVYGPKLLGSWAAVSSGRLNSATADVLGSTISNPSNARASTAHSMSHPTAPNAAQMPAAVFRSTGDDATQALEGVMIKYLVGKASLTLMQLQRGIQAISVLDSPFQLAAIGVLLRGGCWLGAMQVAYADFAVLAEVLVEMKLMMETYLQWDSQAAAAAAAAAAWFWHSTDRDLFMKTFRGLDIIAQYQQLRKQVSRLLQQQKQQQPSTKQSQIGSSNRALAAAAGSVTAHKQQQGIDGKCRIGAQTGTMHPQLAVAEQQMLLSVIDKYLANVDAALQQQEAAAIAAMEAAPAAAVETGRGPLISVLQLCPEAAIAESATDVGLGHAAGVTAGTSTNSNSNDGHSADQPLLQTLQISNDWRILTGTTTEEEQQTESAKEPPNSVAAPFKAYHTSIIDKGDVPVSALVHPKGDATAHASKATAGLSSRPASKPVKQSDSAVRSCTVQTSDVKPHGSDLASSRSPNSSSQPRQQQHVPTAAAPGFSIQSVPAEAITSSIKDADNVNMQSTGAQKGCHGTSNAQSAASTTRKRHVSSREPPSIAQQRASGLPSRCASAGTAAPSASRDSTCSSAAASPAHRNQQQLPAFVSSVPASEVLEMLQQQVQGLSDELASSQRHSMQETAAEQSAQPEQQQEQQPQDDHAFATTATPEQQVQSIAYEQTGDLLLHQHSTPIQKVMAGQPANMPATAPQQQQQQTELEETQGYEQDEFEPGTEETDEQKAEQAKVQLEEFEQSCEQEQYDQVAEETENQQSQQPQVQQQQQQQVLEEQLSMHPLHEQQVVQEQQQGVQENNDATSLAEQHAPQQQLQQLQQQQADQPELLISTAATNSDAVPQAAAAAAVVYHQEKGQPEQAVAATELPATTAEAVEQQEQAQPADVTTEPDTVASSAEASAQEQTQMQELQQQGLHQFAEAQTQSQLPGLQQQQQPTSAHVLMPQALAAGEDLSSSTAPARQPHSPPTTAHEQQEHAHCAAEPAAAAVSGADVRQQLPPPPAAHKQQLAASIVQQELASTLVQAVPVTEASDVQHQLHPQTCQQQQLLIAAGSQQDHVPHTTEQHMAAVAKSQKQFLQPPQPQELCVSAEEQQPAPHAAEHIVAAGWQRSMCAASGDQHVTLTAEQANAATKQVSDCEQAPKLATAQRQQQGLVSNEALGVAPPTIQQAARSVGLVQHSQLPAQQQQYGILGKQQPELEALVIAVAATEGASLQQQPDTSSEEPGTSDFEDAMPATTEQAAAAVEEAEVNMLGVLADVSVLCRRISNTASRRQSILHGETSRTAAGITPRTAAAATHTVSLAAAAASTCETIGPAAAVSPQKAAAAANSNQHSAAQAVSAAMAALHDRNAEAARADQQQQGEVQQQCQQASATVPKLSHEQHTQQPHQHDVQQQQQDGLPQVPLRPCSRPQSHQNSRRSTATSRPGSASIHHISSSDHVTGSPAAAAAAAVGGAVLLSQVRCRPASASAAARGSAAAVQLARPGSSGGSKMGALCIAGSPSAAAAALAAGIRSRPGSAGALHAVNSSSANGALCDADLALSLQRLRDSCAQQRRDIEQMANSATGGSDNTAANISVAVAAAGGVANHGSRPGSPLRYQSSSLLGAVGSSSLNSAAATAAAGPVSGAASVSSRPSSALRPATVAEEQIYVNGPGGCNPHSPAGAHDVGCSDPTTAALSTATAATSSDVVTQQYVPGQLQQVPEESSEAVLAQQHSQAHVAPASVEGQQNKTASPPDSATQVCAQALAAQCDNTKQPASGQQQLQDDLQATMQMFQQRLEQTAYMAQQLLAQQITGQAARRSRPSSAAAGSRSSSRPASASTATGSLSSHRMAGKRPGAFDAPVMQQGDNCSVASALGGVGADANTVSGPAYKTLTTRDLTALGVEEPPSADEVAEYARYLGMSPEQDADLLYIAEWALTAPCPDGWTVHLDAAGNEFFYNTATQASTYEHPLDAQYRQLYQQRKQEKCAGAGKAQ